ncbi:hypothetical protein ABSL23_17335 (plasmid) [Halobacterium sp. NMX12-1]|uniref:Uncharacterized protein n=1 Tax=Halobacterium sp. NMX12-1 TaxID=3166650 RepID=A0AAU8CH95_9EURY
MAEEETRVAILSASDLIGLSMMQSTTTVYSIDGLEEDDLDVLTDLGEAVLNSVNPHLFLETFLADGEKDEWSVTVPEDTAADAVEVLDALATTDENYMWEGYAEDLGEALRESD